MRKKGIEVFGWYGASAILLAYALVSFKGLQPTGFMYQILNFTGALGIVTVSLAKNATQPAVLDGIWAIMALIAIVGLLTN